jgi:hypothetical protein
MSGCAIRSTPVPCAGCRRPFHRTEMSYLYDIPQYAGSTWRRFCAECVERPHQEYEYEGIYWEENRKVLSQLRRAVEKSLSAILTSDQWLDTLDHFGWMCAYRLVAPYEALERLVPIERGGTTADNCAPACKECNSSKGTLLSWLRRRSDDKARNCEGIRGCWLCSWLPGR